jgi:hypothetical protein
MGASGLLSESWQDAVGFLVACRVEDDFRVSRPSRGATGFESVREEPGIFVESRLDGSDVTLRICAVVAVDRASLASLIDIGGRTAGSSIDGNTSLEGHMGWGRSAVEI